MNAKRLLLIGAIALSIAFAKLEPDISLSKGTVYAGDTIEINASVYNSGGQAARDVTLAVNIPKGIGGASQTLTLNRLAAGAVWSPPPIILYIPEGTAPGAYRIDASTSDFSSEKTLAVRAFPLSLEHRIGEGTLSYSVKNTGKDRVDNLTIAVRLPRDFVARGSERLAIGALGPGEQVSHDFAFDIPEGASGTYSLSIEMEFSDGLGKHYTKKFVSLSSGGLTGLETALAALIVILVAVLFLRTKLKK